MADEGSNRDRVMPLVRALALQARRAGGPLSVWLARHPRSFYAILAILWLVGWGTAQDVSRLADDIYLRSTGTMQAVFFVGPAFLVWSNLAPPPRRRVVSVWGQALEGFQRTATATFWIAVSVGVGYFVAHEEGAGRSGLFALLASTGGVIAGAAVVRYVTMVRATMRSDEASRTAAEEVFSPGDKSPHRALRSANVAWLTAHAWRMASTGFGAAAVAASLGVGIWAYVGIFTG